MDVILGMQWLCSMGYTSVHWPSLTMTFGVGDKQITLRGDPALTKSELFLKAIVSDWAEEDE